MSFLLGGNQLRTFALLLFGLVVCTIAIFIWDRLAFDKERQTSHLVLLSFMCYKLPQLFQRFFGMGVAYFVYLPNEHRNLTVPLAEKRNARRQRNAIHNPHSPVWLQPWAYEYGSYYTHYDPSCPLGVRKIPTIDLMSGMKDLEDTFPTLCRRLDIEGVHLRSSLVLESTEQEAAAWKRVLVAMKNPTLPLRTFVADLKKFPRIASSWDTAGNSLVHLACMSEIAFDPLEKIVEAAPRKIPVNNEGDTGE